MTQAQPQRTTSDLVKAAVSGWLGTALEFMDFQLYSLGAALVFHEIFFPEQSAAMALILAMGTYGAGYIARIVGALSSAEWATGSVVKRYCLLPSP